MPIRFIGFEWDDYNEGHIAEHNVSPEEVEECFFNPYVWKRLQRNVAESVIIFMGKLMADGICLPFLSYILLE